VKVRLFEGDYSPDDLARFLLQASGSDLKARKALTRASNEAGPKRASDEALYLAAYAIKKKLRCSDITALKKLLGSKYRVLWDRLKAREQTLEQIARLYPTSAEDEL
jgi:hypothetical protein